MLVKRITRGDQGGRHFLTVGQAEETCSSHRNDTMYSQSFLNF